MIAYYEEQSVTHISSVIVEGENNEIVGRFRYGYDRDHFEGRGEFGELVVYNEDKRSEIEEALDYLLNWRQWIR